MPGDNNPFRKPAPVPDRGDPSAFLNRDFQNPSAELPAAAAPPPVTQVSPVRGRVLKERKMPITYKHRERNFTLLKKLAHRLDMSIGDLLDEALEAKFPEWREKVAALPPEEF